MQRTGPSLGQTFDPLNPYRLREEWANWLAAFPWNHFGTYTFARPRATDASCLRSLSRHRERLRSRGVSAHMFAVVEGEASTRLHLHTLSCLDWAEDGTRLAASWVVQGGALRRLDWRLWYERHGRARIVSLKGDTARASWYVSKYLTKGDDPRWEFLPSRGWDRIVRA